MVLEEKIEKRIRKIKYAMWRKRATHLLENEIKVINYIKNNGTKEEYISQISKRSDNILLYYRFANADCKVGLQDIIGIAEGLTIEQRNRLINFERQKDEVLGEYVRQKLEDVPQLKTSIKPDAVGVRLPELNLETLEK